MLIVCAPQGAASVVCVGMAVHRSNVEVQQWGCAVLGRLAPFTTDDVGEMLRNATGGAVEAVVASLRAHVFSTEVQEAGCTALTKLTFKSSENRAKAVAVGAVEVVGATMRVHATNPSIQEQAWFLLGSLAEAAEARGDPSLDALCIPAACVIYEAGVSMCLRWVALRQRERGCGCSRRLRSWRRRAANFRSRTRRRSRVTDPPQRRNCLPKHCYAMSGGRRRRGQQALE